MAARLEKAILGKKLGMTQIFVEDGRSLAVTLVEAGPCVVVKKRTSPEKPSEVGLQLGFEEIAEEKQKRHLNKPMEGYFKKVGVPPQRHLREFKLNMDNGPEVGDKLCADIFASGEKVDIAGISKGKGFAGAMKRHGFSGGPASHGSMSHRRPASSGATDAARVFKGTRKPGHMGNVRRTVKGVTIVQVDAEKNLLVVEGAVPGPKGGLVEITRAVTRKK